LHLVSPSRPKPTHFRNLQELKDLALSKGFCFPELPAVRDNFFITDHPLSAERLRQIRSISKRDCGLTPVWRGLLWVSLMKDRHTELDSETIGGKKRIWGRLLVAGDEELMDRIEQIVRTE